MPRPKDALRDELATGTRRHLLDAAAAEFAEKGFSGANINQISQSAGFAKGTIYNYFPSKRALMMALIDEIAAQHTAFMVARFQSDPDPVGRLRAFFSAGFEFVKQQPVQARIAINATFNHDEAFRDHIFEAYTDLFTYVIDDVLEAGIAAGVFRAMNTDATMALLMSLYLGSCSLAGPDGTVAIDAETVAEFVVVGLQSTRSLQLMEPIHA